MWSTAVSQPESSNIFEPCIRWHNDDDDDDDGDGDDEDEDDDDDDDDD